MSKPEWKILQEIYHRLNTELSDDAKNFDIEFSDNIVENAIKYFKQTNIGWIWPAKSYMVGICYAKWLKDIYGGEFLEYLNDPELLYNNDPYFKTYKEDQNSYNCILKAINYLEFDEDKGVVPEVRKYFELEFNLKGQN